MINGYGVKVVRIMLGTTPPPTYKAAWIFGDTCDRWQEIEFVPSHLSIWTGAIEPEKGAIDDPNRGGFHLRGFHGITPETETSCHYFWSMCSNKHPEMPETTAMALQNAAHRVHLSHTPPSTVMTVTTTQIMLDLGEMLHGLPPEKAATIRTRLKAMTASVALFASGCGLAALLFVEINKWCFCVMPILGAYALTMRSEVVDTRP